MLLLNEEKITYKTNDFILTGITDFLVSKRLEYSKKPIKNDDPRPQLPAELIAAIEINDLQQIYKNLCFIKQKIIDIQKNTI